MIKYKSETSQAEHRIRRSTLITVVCDVFLIVALVTCLLLYSSYNNEGTYDQNIENISNIAKAKSGLMLSALSRSGHEVEIAYRYCSGKNVDEVMDYLSLVGDSDNEYQLLRRSEDESTDLYHVYAGRSSRKADGEYWNVVYKDTNLSSALYQYSQRGAGEICYSRGFTNKTDAQHYFAVFCGIDCEENGELHRYFLVKPQLETKILDTLETYTQYGRLDTAVCHSDGNYLAKDDSFRAENIYDYIYKYNNLSIDERNALRDSVLSDADGAGYLVYRDLKQQDCVFAYASCGSDNDFQIFVSVPVSAFVSERLLSFFPLTIIIFLAVLLLFNIWRLLIIVRQLRQSVDRERVASMSKHDLRAHGRDNEHSL